MVFPADVFEQIYSWEREEIEDVIWNCFLKRDFSFIGFLPRLNKYDGTAALKAEYEKSKNINIAQILYNETKDSKYLDEIINCIENDGESPESVQALIKCISSPKRNNALYKVYVESDNGAIRLAVVTRILREKGIIENPNSLGWMNNPEKKELFKKLMSDDKEVRKANVEKFINDAFD